MQLRGGGRGRVQQGDDGGGGEEEGAHHPHTPGHQAAAGNYTNIRLDKWHLPSSQSWQHVDWLNCLWGCTKIQLETNWKIYRSASQTIKSKTLLLHFAELCSRTYYFSYLCDCSRQYTVLCIATTSSTWKVDERRMLEPHSYHNIISRYLYLPGRGPGPGPPSPAPRSPPTGGGAAVRRPAAPPTATPSQPGHRHSAG